jgi:hypothetical protein
MLDREELVRLEAELRDRTVLSVYINGESHDPAKRHQWRLDLRHALDGIQASVAYSPHAEREDFARCRATLEQWLETAEGAVGAPGWAGFVTVDGAHAGGPLPVEVPTLATWSKGAAIAPYLRVLKESLPVFVAVVDARKASLFKYAGGRVTALGALRAHTAVEPPLHMGKPPRQGFHSGTRGRTGKDAAQREGRDGTAHLLADLRDELVRRVRGGGWIVIGGIPEVAAAALRLLPADVEGRAARADALDVHATHAQVAECARTNASALRAAFDLGQVNQAMADADRFARGEVGPDAVKKALQAGNVETLYLTSTYVAAHTRDAEELVRLAFESSASVDHVSGAAADRLETVGGVAARLRYAGAGVAAVPEPSSSV